MKKLQILFLTLGFCLMALPALALPFFRDAVNTEKRTLSALPVLRDAEGFNESFPEEMNTWVQEHIGFRNELIAANSLLRASLFGQAVKDGVILGREGWLFYADTLEDYLNVPTMSRRGASGIAHSLRLLQNFAQEQGSAFLFVLAPNKNSLYGDYMPAHYDPLAQAGSRELLFAALAGEQVSAVDLGAVLNREDLPYHKTDSHWTYAGALSAYRAVMEASGLPHESFEGLTFAEKQNWPADLAVFLYGEAAQPDGQAYPERSFTYYYKTRNAAVDSLGLETGCETGSGSLLAFRDSFFNTAQAYFAQSFEEAFFSRVLPYQARLIAERRPDLTVLEIAERNIRTLLESAPVMPAPRVYPETAAYESGGAVIRWESREADGLFHVYGLLAESLLGDSYEVFLIAQTAEGERAYEAFPLCEKTLLGLEEVSDCGFSAYLEPDCAAAALAVLIHSQERYYYCPLPAAQQGC